MSLVSRNATKLSDVSSKCTAAGSEKTVLVSADLAKEEDCVMAVEETIKQLGG